MLLEYVPLLQVQRDLYTIPRGGTRFRAYLRTMIDPHTRDLRLPLVNMNPMGKDHVPQLIDELLSLDADGVARRAMEQAAAAQRAVAGSFRVALVVVDDVGGGWTNRYTNDYANRFATRPLRAAGSPPRHGPATRHRARGSARKSPRWCIAPPISSPTERRCRWATCWPRRAHAALRPLLRRRDRPTVMACLYGDRTAQALGYPPQGLSDYAGLALALHQARAESPAANRSEPAARGTPRAADMAPP